MRDTTTALVTGATGAIGRAIAWQLASMENFEVVITARNEDKAKTVVEEIKLRSDNPQVSYEIVDLSRYKSVKDLRNRWKGPLHILVNNAGATPKAREETPEGIEMQLATNILGYYWMMDLFSNVLETSAPSRIVNVASYWAGNLDLNDLEFIDRRYNNDTAYRQSKQADRMLTVAFAKKLKPYDITVNACHPGDVNSNLSNNLGYGGHETPDQGADTPVWVATSPTLDGVTGKYFERGSEQTCQFGQDSYKVDRLIELCQQYS